MMAFTLHWPWAGPIAFLAAIVIIVSFVVLSGRRDTDKPKNTIGKGTARVYSLDDDLRTEHASRLLRIWRNLGRTVMVLLALALILALVLISRPSQVDKGLERSNSRDIVLCLDVSGSTLPYDREVINTYLQLVGKFQGERIGLSIFNSTSRTVFPLTDDYALITRQLKSASAILKGVQSQDDINHMSDKQYQSIADWLDGTQNRTDVTSLIGDGLVGCAAMLPGFIYGSPSNANAAGGGSAAANSAAKQANRAASIVLATDNVVSGKPTYTLSQALDLTKSAGITVDGLFSGPKQTEGDQTTIDMKTAIQSHGGTFNTQSNGTSISELVQSIERRKTKANKSNMQAAFVDAPGWWTLALAALTAAWIGVAWRLKR